jgi:hypothetical protein
VKIALIAVAVVMWDGFSNPSAADGLENPSHMVRSVDAKHLEHTIRTLVAFGTRSTLSVQDDPKRGIGAARDWIKSEFDKIAATSGGRMTVELQSFTQEPGKFPRIAKPTVVTNVVATLRGTQSPDRVYVVTTTQCAAARRTRRATRPAPTTTLPAWRWCWRRRA